MLSKFATEDGDYAQAAAYTKQATDEIARITELNRLQQQRDQLKASALYQARQSENPEQEVQRVLNMTDEQRVAYTTPKDPLVVGKDESVLSGEDPTQVMYKPDPAPVKAGTGERLYMKGEDGQFVEVAYNAPEKKPIVLPDGAFLIGNGKDILVKNMRDLDAVENQGLGELPAKVEEASQNARQVYNDNRNGSDRALNLLELYAENPDRAAGVFGSIKTSTYNFLGVTDESEQEKRRVIREKNEEIVRSLPPGVASDTDVEIFSRGFPDDNATAAEIMAYLRVSAAAQAYTADQALLFDNYLMKQRNQGITPSSAGSTRLSAEYRDVFDAYSDKIKTGKISKAEASEQMEIIYGFKPLAFRFVQEEPTTP